MKKHCRLQLYIAPDHSVDSYDEAWIYCLTLDYNGYKDWRMPTREEWGSSHDSDIRTKSYYQDFDFQYSETASYRTCISPVRDI